MLEKGIDSRSKSGRKMMEKYQDESCSDKEELTGEGANKNKTQTVVTKHLPEPLLNIKSLYHHHKFLDPTLTKTRSCSCKNLDTWKHSKKWGDSGHAKLLSVPLLLAHAYFGF